MNEHDFGNEIDREDIIGARRRHPSLHPTHLPLPGAFFLSSILDASLPGTGASVRLVSLSEITYRKSPFTLWVCPALDLGISLSSSRIY